MRRARVLLVAALVAPLAAACNNGPTTPDATTTTAVPAVISPVTETFASQLAVGGSSSRSFNAAKPGTATVRLVSAGPPSTVKIGFGVGIPDALGSGCLFARSLETAAGAELSLSVDAGTYCVRVYDPGTLTAVISFSVTIVRP